ncbi:TRAP transporter large permease [Microvirga massiliensis]|uniref:TRAP transporter large permease n=1 Tax=Microvirga massiliensis TaxID=1033741 RepID=UPI00062B7C94|nr:TRAP transporter large permease [Microvirga massiliensis]
MAISTISISFFVALVILMLGIPVAVVMAGMGVVGGLATAGAPMIESLGSVIWSVQNENLLTAIPLFILLGEILLRSGLADRMYIALSVWLGRLPGGLLHANMSSCALFAATCGSSVATAATIGTVALPALKDRGYDIRQTLGSLAAGGTLGILIPPSVAMLVYGSITNNSIGKLFIAGVIPGILLTLLFMTYIAYANWHRGELVEVRLPLKARLYESRYLIPPFVIFGVVMGSLYMGWATPTESASLGVIIAIGFALTVGRFDLATLHHCFRQTATITGMIILIICGSFILNVTLNFLSIPQVLTKFVTSLGVGPTEIIFLLIVFYLILGCFLEVLSMQVTTIPIAYPIVTHLGVDPIWFGVFIVLMSEIAMITPPVGMNLYVVQSIRRDGGSISDVIAGVWPYVVMMLGFTVFLWYVPQIVLWLPQQMF